MSRLGKRPIIIEKNITVDYKNTTLKISGPKGELKLNIHKDISLLLEKEFIKISPKKDNSKVTPMLGTTWSLIQSYVIGVSKGFIKELNLVGVGYRATYKNNNLEMNLGYSKPVIYNIPKNISIKVNANTNIVLECADKQLLGQVCSEIRKFRPPEPYKGKGILYKNEKLKRKAGKAGKT